MTDQGRLEICIPKVQEDIHWETLFEGGDDEGEEIIDESLMGEVHQRLAHLTSDQWVRTSCHPVECRRSLKFYVAHFTHFKFQGS